MRSRRASHSRAMFHVGIISACAEQTTYGQNVFFHNEDHLRVCGADSIK